MDRAILTKATVIGPFRLSGMDHKEHLTSGILLQERKMGIWTAVMSVLCLAMSFQGVAQGFVKHHPLLPDTLGWAHCVWACPPDQVAYTVYDYTDTVNVGEGLTVGMHHFQAFDSLDVVVLEFDFEIFQLEWNLNFMMSPYNGLLNAMMSGYIQWCGSQFSEWPTCVPDPQQTYFRLWQDMTNVVFQDNQVHCDGTNKFSVAHPFGHSYTFEAYDIGSCGTSAFSPTIVAFSAGNGNFNITTQNISGNTQNLGGGGGTGSIEVLEVLPDPNSPLPPPLPFSGTFSLSQWPSMTPVGAPQQGSSAYWGGLLPGQYRVLLTPDVLCNEVDTIITIDAITGVQGLKQEEEVKFLVWPQPASGMINWAPNGSAGVQVFDQRGRLVRTGTDQGWMDVSDLPQGLYELRRGLDRTRFVRW